MTQQQETIRNSGSDTTKVFRFLDKALRSAVKDYSGTRYYVVKHPQGYARTYELGTQESREFLLLLCKLANVLPKRRLIEDLEYMIEARVSEKVSVHTRIGYSQGVVYVDTGEPDWTILRIDSTGWEYIPYERCPIVFVRPSDMQALPRANDASADAVFELFRFMNLTEEDKMLTLAWLLSLFNPTAPFPILAITGHQGTAKTTLASLLRRFVDPSDSMHQSLPTNERDLSVSAGSSYLLAFDNISAINPRMADALCRVSTGAGLRERRLYTNKESHTVFYRRPVVLTGITDYIRAADLGDRVIQVTTQPISKRITERRFWEDVKQKESDIFTGLLHGVVSALKHLSDVEMRLESADLPRMADVAVWSCAAMMAYGFEPEQTLRLLSTNKSLVNTVIAEQRPLVEIIGEFMETRTEWVGTPSELFRHLFPDGKPDMEGVPTNSVWMARELNQIAPLLKDLYGIEVQRCRETRKRVVVLRRLAEENVANENLFTDDPFVFHQPPTVGHRADELLSWSGLSAHFFKQSVGKSGSLRNGSYRESGVVCVQSVKDYDDDALLPDDDGGGLSESRGEGDKMEVEQMTETTRRDGLLEGESLIAMLSTDGDDAVQEPTADSTEHLRRMLLRYGEQRGYPRIVVCLRVFEGEESWRSDLMAADHARLVLWADCIALNDREFADYWRESRAGFV